MNRPVDPKASAGTLVGGRVVAARDEGRTRRRGVAVASEFLILPASLGRRGSDGGREEAT